MGCSLKRRKSLYLLEERGATREKERGGEWDKVEEGGDGGGSRRGRKKKAARGERGAKEQKEQERKRASVQGARREDERER